MTQRVVLDTDVVSAAIRGDWPLEAQRWFEEVASLFALTVITLMELRYGVERMPDGRRRDAVERGVEDILLRDNVEILPFTSSAAVLAGSLRARRDAAGRPLSLADAQIAAICLSREVALATRNVRDFEGLGLELVDPWTLEGTS